MRPTARTAIIVAALTLPALGGCSLVGWDDEEIEEGAVTEAPAKEEARERQMCLREYRLLDLSVELCKKVGGVAVVTVPPSDKVPVPDTAPVSVVAREALPADADSVARSPSAESAPQQ